MCLFNGGLMVLGGFEWFWWCFDGFFVWFLFWDKWRFNSTKQMGDRLFSPFLLPSLCRDILWTNGRTSCDRSKLQDPNFLDETSIPQNHMQKPTYYYTLHIKKNQMTVGDLHHLRGLDMAELLRELQIPVYYAPEHHRPPALVAQSEDDPIQEQLRLSGCGCVVPKQCLAFCRIRWGLSWAPALGTSHQRYKLRLRTRRSGHFKSALHTSTLGLISLKPSFFPHSLSHGEDVHVSLKRNAMVEFLQLHETTPMGAEGLNLISIGRAAKVWGVDRSV